MSALVEIPGAVNAHTHLYSGLAPLGMPVPDPPPATFLEILGRVWWRLDRALDAGTLRAAARYHVAHALLAGTTTLVDHHESPAFIEGSLDVLAAACDELGARAVLCYGATERNQGRDEARRGLAECRRFAASRRAGRLRGAVGLHASFTVSDDTLREAGDLARALGVPVHVHLAEDMADVADARARGHEGPLARLLAAGALPRGSILAHGVHLAPEDVQRCAELGLWLVHNPRSNANNRVGYAKVLSHTGALAAPPGATATPGAARDVPQPAARDVRQSAPRVALGTDGFPSDMIAERDALAREAAAHGDRAADPDARLAAGRALAAEIFGSAAIEGDRVRIAATDDGDGDGDANGNGNGNGNGDGNEGGARTSEGGAAAGEQRRLPRVVEVDVDGEPVVRGGRLTRATLASIETDARRAARALWARMEELP